MKLETNTRTEKEISAKPSSKAMVVCMVPMRATRKMENTTPGRSILQL